MSAHCTPSKLEFGRFFNRQVTARFDGGRMSSDGGAIVLREVEQTLNLFERLTQCFTDYRNPRRCEHRTWELLAQRIYGIALGYEDLNDHDRLRFDSVLALLCDKPDVVGSQRKRRRDVGVPLAGSSTLNRLELGVPGQAAGHRYKKIVGDEAAMDHLLVEIFLESRDEAPGQIRPDLDATDDLAHGHQEGIFITATMTGTATCRCISSVTDTCCVPGCDLRGSMPVLAPMRSWCALLSVTFETPQKLRLKFPT